VEEPQDLVPPIKEKAVVIDHRIHGTNAARSNRAFSYLAPKRWLAEKEARALFERKSPHASPGLILLVIALLVGPLALFLRKRH
jgi:hypothetical protein